MSYSNTTSHYNLPQYVASDIPSVLSDVNDAYAAIDTAIYNVAASAGSESAAIDALTTRVTNAETNIATLQSDLDADESTIQGQGTAITSLQARTTTVETKVASLETATTSNTNRIAVLEQEVSGGSVEVQTGTLTAGQTSVVLTFTDQTIGATTLVDWYSADALVSPTAIATTANTVTLTFEAQAADMGVAVKVQNL